ncbi:MAG: helix-turn-helix transcriptional regulator [Clostridia bacterium]|nr:helix-turn-helix transcriptional regulator [Clostridia bacterium]
MCQIDIARRLFCCTDPQQPVYDVCGRLFSPGGFCHHRRTFECHVLILMLEGTLYITAGGIARAVHAGEYLFLRAGEEHFGHQPSEGRLSYLWVHIRTDSGFLVMDAETDAPYLFAECGDVPNTARLASRFQQLIDMSLEEPVYPAVMMDCACAMLLMELNRLHTCQQPAKSYPPVVLAVMEWIRSHYHQPFSVPELTQHVNYQPDYLSGLFKRSTGVSIVQYTNQLRLRMAKALLTNYEITIKEAAYSCGFPDEKYFMRLFRREEGMTPSQFRSLQVK